MLYRNSIGAIALAVALLVTMGAAQAFDESKYPDWKGQWRRGDPGGGRYDPSKPLAAQEAPLTEEYKKIHAASIADQAAGGQGNDPTYTCVPPGMPRIMNVYDPMEIIITPSTTQMSARTGVVAPCTNSGSTRSSPTSHGSRLRPTRPVASAW